jgi:hypothetical protein
MTERTNPQPPLACDLTAIDAEQRAAHRELAAYLVSGAAQERRELADGYAFRFPAERYADLAAFIANERLCCPFFRFVLEVTPAQGPIWLRITGPDGVKLFFEHAFGT